MVDTDIYQTINYIKQIYIYRYHIRYIKMLNAFGCLTGRKFVLLTTSHYFAHKKIILHKLCSGHSGVVVPEDVPYIHPKTVLIDSFKERNSNYSSFIQCFCWSLHSGRSVVQAHAILGNVAMRSSCCILSFDSPGV